MDPDKALEAATDIAELVDLVDDDSYKCVILAAATRMVLRGVASRCGRPLDDMIAFYVRRLTAKEAQPSLMQALDKVIRDFRDAAAGAVLIVGGKHEGGATGFTESSKPEHRGHLIQALRGLAAGLERGQNGGEVDLYPGDENLS